MSVICKSSFAANTSSVFTGELLSIHKFSPSNDTDDAVIIFDAAINERTTATMTATSPLSTPDAFIVSTSLALKNAKMIKTKNSIEPSAVLNKIIGFFKRKSSFFISARIAGLRAVFFSLYFLPAPPRRVVTVLKKVRDSSRYTSANAPPNIPSVPKSASALPVHAMPASQNGNSQVCIAALISLPCIKINSIASPILL